jgi:hypothetical protein
MLVVMIEPVPVTVLVTEAQVQKAPRLALAPVTPVLMWVRLVAKPPCLLLHEARSCLPPSKERCPQALRRCSSPETHPSLNAILMDLLRHSSQPVHSP